MQASDTIDIARIRAETPGIGARVHLLAAGSALMPQPVVDAVVDHTRLEAQVGGYEAQAQMQKRLDNVYGSVARHLGARRREIALLENATVAWCHAFYALPFKPGARILTCEAEYGANYVAFLQRARAEDLRIEVIPSGSDGTLDLGALERSMDSDVGLVAITWVPTNGGLVNPAAEVGRIAKRHGVPYLLDACQAVGQMRVDVDEIGCDFLSGTGRKFLRGPRGTGFLYVREAWLESLEPAMIDHFAAPWVSRDSYALRDDARRFETWENSYALRAGLGAAFDYAEGVGIAAIEARVRALADYSRTLLDGHEAITLLDLGPTPCGIVSFTLADTDPVEIVAELARRGVEIGLSPAASTRIDAERRHLPTVLRIAPHYYNTQDEIAHAVNEINAIANDRP
ncbi:MAG: aminotransferase class V-fold PLP-dependent enzyme [Pseudomonadota bacterium]